MTWKTRSDVNGVDTHARRHVWPGVRWKLMSTFSTVKRFCCISIKLHLTYHLSRLDDYYLASITLVSLFHRPKRTVRKFVALPFSLTDAFRSCVQSKLFRSKQWAFKTGNLSCGTKIVLVRTICCLLLILRSVAVRESSLKFQFDCSRALELPVNLLFLLFLTDPPSAHRLGKQPRGQ